MGVGFLTRLWLAAVNYMRKEANIFDGILYRVGLESIKRVTPGLVQDFRKAFEPGLKLARTVTEAQRLAMP